MAQINPSNRDRKLFELFDAAIDMTPSARVAFVSRACGSDAELRIQLEGMLDADVGPLDVTSTGAGSSGDKRTRGSHNDSGPPASEVTVPDIASLAAFQATNPGFVARPGNGPVLVREAAAPEPAGSRSGASGNEPRPGTRLGQYEIIREIGRGGMGAVYMARDTKLGRRVAIKFLQSTSPALAERFTLEAQATARCAHENIVVIHDVNEHGGAPFMVLEYLKGQPLGRLLADGRLPSNRAVQLIVPVVRALVCAHEHKIVHRDLKPNNIFMTESGVIKVLDFGIAKFVNRKSMKESMLSLSRQAEASMVGAMPAIDITGANVIMGTMPYMSPEQWGVDTIDHRSDIWAVGIILYSMLAGRHPITPLSAHALMSVGMLDEKMPSVRDANADIPAGLADVIDRCLKKRKAERLGTAKELLSELERFLPDRRRAEISLGESPYAGLNAFQEADASRFFGRFREVEAAVTRLHGAPMLAAVGPSGVGKSSFLRAGVIPALKRSGESWRAMVLRPGRHPMAALANIVVPLVTKNSSDVSDQIAEHQKALQRLYQEPGYLGTVLRNRARTDNQKIAFFIDQFEELFTLTPDVNERRAFTACLAGLADDAVSPLRLLLSIRSDFLAWAAEDRQFMAELSQHLFFLAPPDREGLHEAITRPAEMMGYRFESAHMVEHMLDTLASTPGCLPLLQFAATKLWESRDSERRLVTEASYRALGGVAGALATHADAVLQALPPKVQALAQTVFLQLVTSERTRAIASVAELCELTDKPDEVERLIAHLVEARLLVVQPGSDAGGATVEIVHESLIHTWPQLAHWLEANQDDAVFLEQLRSAAKQWDGRERSADLLWRGDTMEEARSWYRRYRGTLSPLQQQFLQSVFALGTRTARRRRIALAGTIAMLSLLVAAAAVALVLIGNAESQAREQAALARAAGEESQRRLELVEAKEAARLAAEQEALEKDEARIVAEQQRGESETRTKMTKAELAIANRELERKNQALMIAFDDGEKARRRLASALVDADMATAAARQARRDADKLSEQLKDKLREEKERNAQLRSQIDITRTLP